MVKLCWMLEQVWHNDIRNCQMDECSKKKGKIISVDVDFQCFELARKLLAKHRLEHLVNFVQANLLNMPEIKTNSIDIITSTRTISDINKSPCQLIRAISEFYRVLKNGGRIVLSDECPCLSPSSDEEEIAVLRWRLAKAISHLIGRPHGHEVKPEDLEFMLKLVDSENVSGQFSKVKEFLNEK